MERLRVAVTGGAGRLGRYVTRTLAGQHAVRVLDTAPPSGADQRQVDVRDLAALRTALQGIEAVVHLAAIDRSVPAPEADIFHTNVQGTWNVLHAAEQEGVRRVVLCSSVAAIGLDHSNPGMPPLYLPVDEAHPLRPSDTYGTSKRAGEAIAEASARRGRIEVLALRPAFVAFPEAHGFMRGGALSPGPDGGPRDEPLPTLRGYVGPEDCARAFLLALAVAEYRGFEAFLVTADDAFCDAPTVPRLEALYGCRIPVRDAARYEGDPHASAFTNASARARLGWSPTTRWPDRLSDA